MSKQDKFDVIVRYEPKKLSKVKAPRIGLLMMVKNEHQTIKVSLDSVKDYVQCFIIYDTGSTDDTIEIITNYCKEHKMNLYMIQGDFVNFSTSRNVLLNFADTIDHIQYLLLLDSNDQLRGGPTLRKFAKQELKTDNSAFLTSQEWWSGKTDRYFNIRFIKPRCGWFYKGVVHEHIYNINHREGQPQLPNPKIPVEAVLYQDRTKDDDKSSKRFSRDKVLLLAEHKKEPDNPRTLFYLAQTFSCLGDNEEALKYYQMRVNVEGFWEERFHSQLRSGEIAWKLGHSWAETMQYYLKAVEVEERAEPLYKIANYYRDKEKWKMAYYFGGIACKLEYPVNNILFIDREVYDYQRYHLLGIVAFYAGRMEDGKWACTMAIKARNKDVDKNNLKFYEKRMPEQNQLEEEEKKKEKPNFIRDRIKELKNKYPKKSNKQLRAQAIRQWKKEKNSS
jgi:glycosyltransferase involved in cell wall biosynthesis